MATTQYPLFPNEVVSATVSSATNVFGNDLATRTATPTTNWYGTWGFTSPPSGFSVDTGTNATVRVGAVKNATGTSVPTIAVDVYENGSLVTSLATAEAISSDIYDSTAHVFQFSASLISNWNNVQIKVTATTNGGGPNRRGVDLVTLDLAVYMTAPIVYPLDSATSVVDSGWSAQSHAFGSGWSSSSYTQADFPTVQAVATNNGGGGPTTESGAVTANNYHQFTVSRSSGTWDGTTFAALLSVYTSLSAITVYYFVRSSDDSYASNLASGSIVVSSSVLGYTSVPLSIDLSAFTNKSSVTFRIYKYASTQYGTLAVDSVLINASEHVSLSTVSDTLTSSWNVLTSVPDTFSSSWEIRQQITDTQTSAWDVLTPVQDTLSSAWDVLTSVPDTLQSAWSVYTAVPDTLQSAWSVAAVVGDSFTSAWDVQAVLTTVADTFDSSWSIVATVEDTFSSAWDVRTVVADTQASAWDVLTTVGQSVSSAWDIATPPELLYASSVVAASVLNAANVVGAMDGTYTTDTAKAWFGIWAMDTLAADYFPETATLYVRARSAVTTGRAYHVWLYEDGKPVEQVVASQSVTTTGTTYSHTVNVGKIRDKTKVQIRVDGDYSSTDSVQLDAIWLEVTPPVGQVRKGLDSSWDINDTANTAATWDFSYPSTTPAPTSVGPGWTVSAWVAGPGLNTGLTASNSDNDEAWRAAFTAGAMPTTAYSTEPVARAGSTASGVAAAVSGDKYIEMTFSRTDNGEFTPDAIAFKAARGGASAGRGMVLRSSANSFATDIGTIGSFPTRRPTWTNYDIDLSGIGAVTSLTLRFYIYTDGVASATIEFDDFALTAVPASSTTTVGDSLVSSWDVLTPVADTLPSSWDVLTTVADSQASSWDVLSTVADSQASAWGVAQQITDSINSAWEIRQQITDSINSAWDIRAAVVDSISSAWDIRALVADTLPSSWDVSATVADTLPSSWDVLTTTNDSVNVAWDVLTPVADSVNAAWDVFTSVNDSISSAWEIRQQIIDSINSAWDIRAIVSDSLPSAWDVLATTSDSVTSAWDVYSSVTDSVGSAWDVLTTVSDSTPSAWAVYLLAEDSLSTAWNANQTITDTLPSSWDVYAIGQVSTGFMSAWSLYSVLGDTFTSSWTVHQAVTDSATSAWNVLASVTDQTTSSWNVYGAVAASRNVAWDVYVEVTIGKSSAWSVYEVLGDSLSSAWEVRALAGDSLTTTWEVLALVEDTLPSAWVVYEHGFNSFDTAWDLDGRAVPIPTPSQYPGAVHGPGIYDVRVYHDRMRVVVYERMEASPHARMEVDL